MRDTRTIFEQIGGKFTRPPEEIALKLNSIRCFIFDWDGVFNDGEKDPQRGSTFSEIDSMGVNLLRFSYWLKYKKLPICSIMTGARNLIAKEWAEREHFDSIAIGAVNKIRVYEEFRERNELRDDEVAFVFDDVLDLSIAQICGLSMQVGRNVNPYTNEFIRKNVNPCYTTGGSGGQQAVREICELIIGLMGNQEEAIEKRAHFKPDYQDYLAQRAALKTEIITI